MTGKEIKKDLIGLYYGTTTSPDYREEVERAIELAERDTAKEPIIFYKSEYAFCQTCGSKLDEQYRFCPNCGQRLWWGREEEEE